MNHRRRRNVITATRPLGTTVQTPEEGLRLGLQAMSELVDLLPEDLDAEFALLSGLGGRRWGSFEWESPDPVVVELRLHQSADGVADAIRAVGWRVME